MGEREIDGRYVLQELIGRGGMGSVWRAHDRVLRRTVALKEVLLPPSMDSDEAEARYRRLEREAQIAGGLSHHPGIVTVHDVFRDSDGLPWIVMQYIPSQSLDDLVTSGGPLTALRTGRIGHQLLDALAAAHDEGVLHRDMKPGNVLIASGRSGEERDERALLTDFGIALSEGDTRLTLADQMSFQTPGYTAPERYAGQDATAASDLWSLGATLFTAVEGYGPFERETPTGTMYAVVHDTPPAAPSAGPLLGQLIAALLDRDPSARPSAADAANVLARNLPLLAGEAGQLSFLAAALPHSPPVTEAALRAGFTEPAETRDPRYSGPSRPVLPAPVVPTQTTDAPIRGGYAEPRRPASGPRSPADVPRSASDLQQEFNRDAGGSRRPARRARSRSSQRHARRLAAIGGAVTVVIAAVVFVVLGLRQHPAGPGTILSKSTPASDSISPTAPSASLPPVKSAAAVARAIDQVTAMPGYKPERMTAASAGTTAGFSLAIPQNWTMNPMGQQTYQYTPQGPANGITYVDINLTTDRQSNMVAEAMLLAGQHRAIYPHGYQPVFGKNKSYVQPEPIRGTAGALWQFDYVSNGITMRMDVLLFTLDRQSYTIYMTAKAGLDDDDWNKQTLPVVEKILGTFEPLPA